MLKKNEMFFGERMKDTKASKSKMNTRMSTRLQNKKVAVADAPMTSIGTIVKPKRGGDRFYCPPRQNSEMTVINRADGVKIPVRNNELENKLREENQKMMDEIKLVEAQIKQLRIDSIQQAIGIMKNIKCNGDPVLLALKINDAITLLNKAIRLDKKQSS
jgi:hypothetical protein